ncbi:6-phosphogluconolactonase [Aurantimonas sp. MSK8Z-1]|uniref:6-phosphogluconolactonase n=1 Tax=Mangrovibrevibacter kandeliae TaxID=2968473 RepID=UPI002117A760|nr:6-phosphogluconolactonase [Aurantimonas sp. MSK8Z-1]MCW4116405.1 6-phosphogluconolactonase [Aurantimonas sp. MSK8Z-1]
MAPARHTYTNREALAEALATGVAAVLAGGIATRGSATLAVSGGSTPKRFFEVLSGATIEWDRVTVTLVDERWVPDTDARSNAGLVRRHLLQGPAAAAQFEPLYRDSDSPDEALDEVAHEIGLLSRPLDVVILGMGADGHTASFFPGADTLAAAIDPAAKTVVAAVRAASAGEPRITLTLPILAEARFLALHIEGADKKATLDAALQDGPIPEYPVRAVLHAERVRPLEVFWAP